MAEEISDWSARLSEWRISGKSGAVWCRDNGIGYYQFQYWQKKLRKASQPALKTGQFVPLKVASTSLRLECNGIYLHVSSGFDPALLRQLISVLKGS
jgi:hypothetical protein